VTVFLYVVTMQLLIILWIRRVGYSSNVTLLSAVFSVLLQDFIFTMRSSYASVVFGIAILSVSPSVRLSDCPSVRHTRAF